MSAGSVLTRLGKHRKLLVLLALTLFAYVAAINRAQSFLWVIPALLSATLITGFAWPRWLVRRLSVRRSGPERAEEGETVEFRVDVENRGWLPRFMVELVDHLPFADDDGSGSTDGRRVLGLLACLPGRCRRRIPVPVVCAKRGHYRLGPVGLASGFPLGLTEARSTRNDGIQTLTIYPQLFPILALPLHGAPSQIHRGGYLLPEGAGAAEFSGLREYRRGDNPRHVHWPTTARLNELMVREYEPLASACLYLLLDQAAGSDSGRGRHSTFEYAVRIAASMARTACGQNIRTRLAGAGRLPLRTPAGSGNGHFQDLLDALARVAADGETPYAKLLNEIGPQCTRGETAVVFLAEPPACWPATLQALSLLRARQVHLLAIVFETSSFAAADTPAAGSRRHPRELVAALLELGAQCLSVRRDDDLLQLFNP